MKSKEGKERWRKFIDSYVAAHACGPRGMLTAAGQLQGHDQGL